MKGPLVWSWRTFELPVPQAGCAGTAHLTLENRGSARWRPGRVKLSYHWLDEHGNAIVWDGLRNELPHEVEPGAHVELDARFRAPIPPGAYQLAFDLVEEGRFWFAELGNEALELDVEVEPRPADDAVAHLQEVDPAPGWHELVRAAHERGYAAVSGSIERGRRGPKELEPYAPGGGRDPTFGAPLVCPSLLPPLVPNTTVAGLPAWLPEGDEPWLYDGRITARLRAGRPRG